MDISTIINAPSFARFGGLIWLVVQILFWVGLVGGISYFLYVKYKLYDYKITIKAVGNNNNLMIQETRGKIRLKQNDLKLWRGAVLPIPERRIRVPLLNGGWAVEVYKFGEKDFTFIEPHVSEEGVTLKAVPTDTRKLAAILFQEEQIKLNKVKWYNLPIVQSFLILMFVVIITYIVMSNMSTVADAFLSAAGQCNAMVEKLAVCVEGRGEFIQR